MRWTNGDGPDKQAWIVAVSTACLLCAMASAGGLLFQRRTTHRLTLVAPFLQPREARMWECAYEVSRIPDGDTGAGSRMKRLKLGVVWAYWW